jgi:hypothetical protein
MNEPLIIGAVVVIVLACCLLGWLVYKVGESIADAKKSNDAIVTALGSVSAVAESFGAQCAQLRKSIEGAAEHFAPVRDIQCTKCGGTGVVEKENPLWTALAEALEANTVAARKGRK